MSIPPRISEPALEFMQARTIAIWGDHRVHTKGEPIQYGSGVLIQVADSRFIVTAHHICEAFLKHGYTCAISGAAKLVPLDKTKVWHTESADVAIIPLTESMWTALSPAKKFARLSELDARDETHKVGGIYCVFGYPHAASKTDHDARVHKMVAEHVWGRPVWGEQATVAVVRSRSPNRHRVPRRVSPTPWRDERMRDLARPKGWGSRCRVVPRRYPIGRARAHPRPS